ncbi:MAG: PP2C family protein-serine/threonine phosphatase [Archangium sp.]
MTQFNGDALLAQITPAGASRFMVADVTGHGLVAAIGSLPLSSMFYGSTGRGDPLHTTFGCANRELVQTLPPTLFVAAAMVEYDPATHRLRVINAGMPPVFVVRQSGLVELNSQSLPLGIVESLTPQPVELEVSPGDLVIAMSDGVVERSNASDVLFGLERVRAALSDGPPSLAFERLVAAVDAFSARSDDVTVVALALQD